jgi:CHAT domain-containing protein/tetratricopeptide (TPR) repeat protein
MHRRINLCRSDRSSVQRASQQRWLGLVASLVLTLGWSTNAPSQSQATPQVATQPIATDQAQVRELQSGQSIERELAGGEVHAYRMTLATGQFLHLIVEQRGIDVAVTVFGPDGKQVAEVDSPNGEQGPEPVFLVTEASGNYRFEVRSFEKGAPRGSYDITIKEVRAATAQDGTRIAAQKAFAEAVQAHAQGTRASLQEAIKKYEEAMPLFKAVGDLRAAANTLTVIGLVYDALSEKHKALDYLNLALPLSKAVGDRSGEAFALTNIGLIYHSLGEVQKGLDYYNLALPLVKALGDRAGEAQTLNNIGLVYSSLGESQKALDYFNLVLPLRKAGGDRTGVAETLHNRGNVYYSLGDMRKALNSYNESLPLRKAVSDRIGEAYTLNSIGRVYHSLREEREALNHFQQAMRLWKAAGDRSGEAVALSNIGRTYDSLGEKQKALDYFNQALPLRKAVGDRGGEAVTLHNIGKVYDSLGDKQRALDFFGQALSLRKAVGDRAGEADTLRAIARVERDTGNLTLARDTIKTALPLIEFIRTNISSQELRSSFFATVQDHYELYIDILMRLHFLDPSAGHDATALQACERARARSLLDLLSEAGADLLQDVDPLLAQRERTLQKQLNAKVEYQFRLLSGKHTPEQAAAVAAELDALTNDFQQAQAQIRATSPAYAALTQSQPLSLREIQQQVLDSETLLLEYSLGEERSYLWLLSHTSLTSFTLPKRSEVEATAVAVTRLLSEGGTPEEFDTRAAQLSRILLAPVAPYLGGKRLVIVGDGALQYVPFAALPQPMARSRSSAALPLMAQHEIITLPSASTLAALRRQVQGRRPAAKSLAVLADPVFTRDDARVRATPPTSKAAPAPATTERQTVQQEDVQQEYERAAEAARAIGLKRAGIDLRRLPFSRREAERLLALVPRRDALSALDFAASQATAMSPDLQQYRIVHFATHGYLNPERPELSGLVLSLVDERGQPQDGFLSLAEVYSMRLKAELVVLSACETGLGTQVRGEGLVGLTRGFMYAGATRVVASLWAVEDRATAEVMASFYTAMLKRKLRPAAALREAQMSMWREARWNDPHRWAGFSFQGEWR